MNCSCMERRENKHPELHDCAYVEKRNQYIQKAEKDAEKMVTEMRLNGQKRDDAFSKAFHRIMNERCFFLTGIKK